MIVVIRVHAGGRVGVAVFGLTQALYGSTVSTTHLLAGTRHIIMHMPELCVVSWPCTTMNAGEGLFVGVHRDRPVVSAPPSCPSCRWVCHNGAASWDSR